MAGLRKDGLNKSLAARILTCKREREIGKIEPTADPARADF